MYLTENLKFHLAENLKFLREQNGKTQEELAVLFGIDQKTISSWECGSRKPPIGTIVSLAKLYRVSLDDLVLTDMRPPIPVYALNLAYLRKKHCMTQQEISELLGYSGKQGYNAIETGKVKPTIDTLEKLADFFGVGRAFFVGAILFGMVPLSMGILGFVGAGMGYTATDTGVINFELISELFPSWAVIPFLFMIVSGLLSTIDSNLCAISSLTTDIFKKNTLGKTKIAMVALLVIGIIVANIPGLTVTHLFLMYGTLRAATLLPTIFTLKGVKLKPEGVVAGIATALIIGLPVFAYGNITGTAAYKTAGSLLTVLLSGTVALIVSRKRGAENGCYRKALRVWNFG